MDQVISDSAGQKLSLVYFQDERGRRSAVMEIRKRNTITSGDCLAWTAILAH
jgi:hypothetical protein